MILCHVTRRVSEDCILSLASAAGLVLESERQLEGPIRMLLFRRQQSADLHTVEVLQ